MLRIKQFFICSVVLFALSFSCENEAPPWHIRLCVTNSTEAKIYVRADFPDGLQWSVEEPHNVKEIEGRQTVCIFEETTLRVDSFDDLADIILSEYPEARVRIYNRKIISDDSDAGLLFSKALRDCEVKEVIHKSGLHDFILEYR